MPFVDSAGELKTKPTQHSVNELRRIGIHPDIVVCRTKERARQRHARQDRDVRRRRASGGDRQPRRAGRLPRPAGAAGAKGSTRSSARSSGSRRSAAELGEWAELTERIAERRGRGQDRARREVREAPRRVPVGARGAQARGHPSRLRRPRPLGRRRGHVARGGRRRARGRRRRARSRRLRVARLGGEDPRLPRRARARDPVPRHLPRDARRGLGVRTPRRRARRRQLDGDGSRDAVPGDRPAARAEGDRGSRRHDAPRRPGGRARGRDAHARDVRRAASCYERHRHRYEVNNDFRHQLVEAGLVVSGTFQDGRLVEIIELPDHPWFVASQFHPEFKSRPDAAGAALPRVRRRGRGARCGPKPPCKPSRARSPT